MKRQIHSFSTAALAALAVLFVGAPGLRAGETNRLDGVVAIVNDRVITAQEIYGRIEPDINLLQQRYARQPAKYREELSKLEAATLEGLIEQALVLSDYKSAGFNIPETLIDDEFQRYLTSRYGDRVEAVKTFQKLGTTLEDERRRFRDNLIVNIMSAQKIRNQVNISPYKIERYYQENQDKYTVEEQVKLRMIILPSQGRNDAAALDRAKDIEKQIQNGAAFEDMAKQYSVGVQAKNGGDMGWNGRKELRKELVDTAFAQATNTVSAPVVTDDAVFILKVEEKKPHHVQPLAEVRDEIEQALGAEESARRRKEWIDGIRQKAFVRMF
jgi:peptidyl-prolyl cis-trans isomerase SurA